MQRRDFVKAIVVASMAAKKILAEPAGQQKNATVTIPDAVDPEVPRTGTVDPEVPRTGTTGMKQGLMESKPLPITPLVPDAVAQTDAHFFTGMQMGTLRRLCEAMMPPLKGNPGAVDAGAPEFLDFLIGVSSEDRQQMYRSGLDRLDAESKQHFAMPFASVTAADADQLLRPLMRSWTPDHPPSEPYIRFINVVHMDIRTATINSQAWHQAVLAAGRSNHEIGLYWFPIDPDMKRENPTPLCDQSSAHS
jgi:hypothetical protein